MQAIFGIKEEDRLIGLLCLGGSIHQDGECTIDFIDGRPDAIEDLLRHALYLARDAHHIAMMVPKSEAAQAPTLPILQQMGFIAWKDFEPDVFLYERTP